MTYENLTDREFLEYVDNQLSGEIRRLRNLRHRVQLALGWVELQDAWPKDTDETP